MLIYCRVCNKEVEPFTTEQVFSNNKTHIRGDCPICGAYIKYLPQYIPDKIDFKEVVMPFGKYKGQKIVDIDQKYLWYLLENNYVSGKIKLCIESLFTPNL